MKQTGLKPRTLYNYKLSVEPETTEETTEETPETVPRFKETTEETAEDTTCNDVEEHIPDALNTNRDVYNEDAKSKRVDDVIEDAERVDDVKEYNTSEAKTSDVLNNGCAKRADDVIEATTSLTTMRCGAHDANLMTAIQDHDLIGVRTGGGKYWVWGQSTGSGGKAPHSP